MAMRALVRAGALLLWLLPLAAACAPAAGPAGGEAPAAGDTAAIGEQQAIAIAREQADFVPHSTTVEAVRESGRAAWRVTLRGRPPGPGHPVGEFFEVLVDRETGEVLTLSRS